MPTKADEAAAKLAADQLAVTNKAMAATQKKDELDKGATAALAAEAAVKKERKKTSVDTTTTPPAAPEKRHEKGEEKKTIEGKGDAYNNLMDMLKNIGRLRIRDPKEQRKKIMAAIREWLNDTEKAKDPEARVDRPDSEKPQAAQGAPGTSHHTTVNENQDNSTEMSKVEPSSTSRMSPAPNTPGQQPIQLSTNVPQPSEPKTEPSQQPLSAENANLQQK